MSFTVRYTNGTTLADIPDQTTNVTDSPIALVGRGALNYGRFHCENFVHILENFCNTTAPAKPRRQESFAIRRDICGVRERL
ncbi:MAG: hypothetical protein EOP83_31340 [Verrucomicrobiaceae bacterium]|nr:MAG: hypothetical protein EOP83_31340 [Verrucomicrobiaceae bacterium]